MIPSATDDALYDHSRALEGLPSSRQSIAQSRSHHTVANTMEPLPADDVKLPDIVFKEGDEQLRRFPEELQKQLIGHIRMYGPSLLWGVACKDLTKSLTNVNGAASHFRTEDGVKLLSARYRFGDTADLTVVKGFPGTFINNSQAALLTYNASFSQIIMEGVRYRRVLYSVWRPDYDVTSARHAQYIHRYIEMQKGQQNNKHTGNDAENSENDDGNSVPHRTRRAAPMKLPLVFKKLEGNTEANFPTYLSDDIAHFIRNDRTLPTCARKRRTDRGLFSSNGKPVQYRWKPTKEILLAGRYECQGKVFDIVQAKGKSNSLGNKSVLVGEASTSRRDFPLEDGTIVCTTFYYPWTSDGRSTKAIIEKLTHQTVLSDTPVIDSAYHPLRIGPNVPTQTEGEDLVNDAGSPTSSSPTRQTINKFNISSSAKLSALSAIDDFRDEHTDEEDVAQLVIPQRPQRLTRRLGHRRQLSDTSASSVPKRQRTNNSGLFKPRGEEDTPLRQRRTGAPPSEATINSGPLSRQEGGFQNSAGLSSWSDSHMPASCPSQALKSASEHPLEHVFVFKAHIVDEDLYPPKSFVVCNEISLLFQHAILAGIADKKTTLLILQSRTQKWSVVRGDPHEFEKVLVFLQEALVAHRIVVTPDVE